MFANIIRSECRPHVNLAASLVVTYICQSSPRICVGMYGSSQWHEVYCYDLEVVSSNPSRVELAIGVRSTSVPSRTWTKLNIFTLSQQKLILHRDKNTKNKLITNIDQGTYTKTVCQKSHLLEAIYSSYWPQIHFIHHKYKTSDITVAYRYHDARYFTLRTQKFSFPQVKKSCVRKQNVSATKK